MQQMIPIHFRPSPGPASLKYVQRMSRCMGVCICVCMSECIDTWA